MTEPWSTLLASLGLPGAVISALVWVCVHLYRENQGLHRARVDADTTHAGNVSRLQDQRILDQQAATNRLLEITNQTNETVAKLADVAEMLSRQT